MLKNNIQHQVLIKAIETIKDYAIFTLDPAGTILTWNLGAEQIEGFRSEEVIGKPLSDLYKQDEDRIIRNLATAKEQGKFEEEAWHIRKDGSKFWAIDTLMAIYDENHQLLGFTRIIRDLTERKQAEEALKRSEQRYRTLIEFASVITWVCNAEGAFTTPQVEWERFTGQSFKEYSDFGWLNAYHLEDRDAVLKARQQASQNKGRPILTRLWHQEVQGYRYVLVQVAPLYDEHGNLLEWAGTGIDVHALKESEIRLSITLDQFALARRAAHAGTWVLDLSNGQLSWDDENYKLFGLDPNSVKVNSFMDVVQAIHSDDREQLRDNIEKAIQERDTYEAEYRVIWPDNSVHHIMSKAYIYRDSKNKAIKLVGMYLDFTREKELIEANKRAEESEIYRKKQVEFINTLCHEVRNPLNGIYGGADIIEGKILLLQQLLPQHAQSLGLEVTDRLLSELTQIKEVLSSINQCALQQKSILDDVLDLSKLDANKVELDEQPFNLKQMINTVVQMFTAQVVQKKLKLSLRFSEGDLYIRGDVHRLTQIMTNLLSNAIKFTHEGSIVIKIKPQAAPTSGKILVSISIEDTGVGMTTEEQTHLFERFKQASAQVSGQFGGSGLGLAICKELIQLMQGELKIKSEKWQGTKFSFTVPFTLLSEQEKYDFLTAKNKRPIESLPSSNKNILIVEDDAMNQKILINYLEKAGYCYQVAANGSEAVEKFRKTKFDVILMDIEMPVMGGLQATKIIREHEKQFSLKRIPIIGLSGNSLQEHVMRAKEVGMDSYLTKPYHKEELYNAISLLLPAPISSDEVQPTSKEQKTNNENNNAVQQPAFDLNFKH